MTTPSKNRFFQDESPVESQSKKNRFFEDAAQESSPAKSYGAGFVGGIRGSAGNMLDLFQWVGQKTINDQEAEMGFEKTEFGENPISRQTGILGSHDSIEQVREGAGLSKQPENALERIMQHSGDWAGQEAVMGSILPGAGTVAGTIHGSIAGAMFGSLLEMGVPEGWALGITALASLSPLAIKGVSGKLSRMMEEGIPFREAIRDVPDAPPPPGGGSAPPGGGIDMPAGRQPPPPPGSSSTGNGMITTSPGNGMITTKEANLKSDIQIAEEISDALSPLNIEQEGRPRLSSVEQTFAPIQEALDEISPLRETNPVTNGRRVVHNLNHIAEETYNETGNLWRESDSHSSNYPMERPRLLEALETVIAELPEGLGGAMGEIRNNAVRLRRRLGMQEIQVEGPNIINGEFERITEHTPGTISNRELVREIRNLRRDFKYAFEQGVPAHLKYQLINPIEEELIRSSTGLERESLINARNGTRQWKETFENPQVLPFRNRKTRNKSAALFKKAENPDTARFLLPIFEHTPEGIRTGNMLRRNIVERTLEPYLVNPERMGTLKFARDMGNLTDIIPVPAQQQIIEGLNSHRQLPGPTPPTRSRFAGIGEKQVGSINTVSDLRELRRDLIRARGAKGEELYKNIAANRGISELFNDQLSIPADASRLRTVLNDRNKLPFLREALGVENVEALQNLVASGETNAAKARIKTERANKIFENPSIDSMLKDPDIWIKSASAIKNLTHGNVITATKQTLGIYKKVKSHIKGQPLDIP